MSKTNTGGPAFPQIYQVYEPHMVGVTLRDYFAAKAMQGLLGRDLELDCDPDNDVLADRAYKIADAMMEARK